MTTPPPCTEPDPLAERIEIERTLAEADRDYEPLDTRPSWRGWLHVGAFIAAIAQVATLVPLAAVRGGGLAAMSTAVYGAVMLLMFGTSALYHRRRWGPRGWATMKRLDHSMIFLFIAGTYAPFAFLGLSGGQRWWVLGVVWGGCTLGIVLKLWWPTAPRWLGVPIYIGIGWTAVFVVGPLLSTGGAGALTLMLVGGVFYSVGAVCYATRWPNPAPGHFGYHEVFHAFTILAAISHYIAIFLLLFRTPLI